MVMLYAETVCARAKRKEQRKEGLGRVQETTEHVQCRFHLAQAVRKPPIRGNCSFFAPY